MSSWIDYEVSSVQRVLADFEEHFVSAFQYGWRQWQSFSANPELVHTWPGLRANQVYAFTQSKLLTTLEDVGCVRPLGPFGPQLLWEVTSSDSVVVCRAKKLDDDMMAANIPTRRASAHNGQLVLGLEDRSVVTVGYLLDNLETEIEAVRCVRYGSTGPIWWYDLAERSNVVVLRPELPLTAAPAVVLDGPFDADETGS